MGREVERWDPPNREISKCPIPLWGATSIKVPGKEAVGPIFNVKRENDFAANELKADPLTQKKPEAGNKVIAYPCYPVEDKKHGFTGVGTPQSPCDVWSCYPNSRPLQQVYASTLWLLWIRNQC